MAGVGGIPLDPLIAACGIPQKKISCFIIKYQSRIGIPSEVMAALYTGMDCLLAPTLGEGFGITVIEAEACETPVIVNNFSAQPELVSDGVSVKGQPIWDASQNAWFQMPLVSEIVHALEIMYERKGERSTEARRHVVENYDADKVYADLWRPLLKDLP
jgi:Glycosyltransferase